MPWSRRQLKAVQELSPGQADCRFDFDLDVLPAGAARTDPRRTTPDCARRYRRPPTWRAGMLQRAWNGAPRRNAGPAAGSRSRRSALNVRALAPMVSQLWANRGGASKRVYGSVLVCASRGQVSRGEALDDAPSTPICSRATAAGRFQPPERPRWTRTAGMNDTASGLPARLPAEPLARPRSSLRAAATRSPGW